ncbi:hypothetical protein L6452_37867 [Arctium lappa]|uniref:Uncharacterized protein n=1 Tax=Arctium lappa TaxID=4217 RepID=A0ACB8Y588_ARCLA|nr:hypothetical protein L6452_37867 [Arctium lappa]
MLNKIKYHKPSPYLPYARAWVNISLLRDLSTLHSPVGSHLNSIFINLRFSSEITKTKISFKSIFCLSSCTVRAPIRSALSHRLGGQGMLKDVREGPEAIF